MTAPSHAVQLGEGHRNIVSLYEVLLTPTHLALSMEYVSGGSLTAYITSKFASNETTGGTPKGLYISEDEARYFFKQFISAVEYCHKVNGAGPCLPCPSPLLACGDMDVAWLGRARRAVTRHPPVYVPPST